MPRLPHFRESGAGPGVVCLHANASSSAQWRSLSERLAPRWRCIAADAWGAGRSPAWPGPRPRTLRDEVALLDPVWRRAGDAVAVVGHSYGAATALVAALAMPQRVRALALYEPTLFSLIDAAAPPPNDADGIRGTVARAARALDAGDADAAARHFVDFWSGAGAWQRWPEPRRLPVRAAVADVRAWAQALFGEPTPLRAFAGVRCPVLLMVGTGSPPSSRAVARLLTRVLPRLQVIEFDGLGHMGPLTHPEAVDGAIVDFLQALRGAGDGRFVA